MFDRILGELRFRLRALFRRDAVDRELADELDFHLAREAEKLAATGMSPEDAQRQARLAFGGVERVTADTRDARGLVAVDIARQDLRYAWRGIRSRPGFAAAVVVTLGLGIGANTAMFTVTDRLLFRAPAMLRDADRVHRLYLTWQGSRGADTTRQFQYARYTDIARWTTSFDRVAAFANWRQAVGTGDDTQELPVAMVSASYFEFFDAAPALGRYFAADEDVAPTGAPVVVISHGLWQSRFGGRPDVIGQTLMVGQLSLSIIGVAPERFAGITGEGGAAVFMPITAFAGAKNVTYPLEYDWSWLEILLRRAPDIDAATATTDLTTALHSSWNAERAITPSLSSTEAARPTAILGPVQLARGPQAGTATNVAVWVSGVTWVVLLISCANVTNLMLARAVRRRREVALRRALGVSTRRLAQQLMTETMLLVTFGALVALVVAQWGGDLLQSLFLSQGDSVSVIGDGRTLLFVALCTVGVALLTGIAPIANAARGDLSTALKSGARDGTHQRSRVRTGLLLFQAMLSVLLLIGAGLFMRSLQNVRDMRLGYDVDPVLLAHATLRGARLGDAERHVLASRMQEVARGTPGVSHASLGISVPFWSNESRALFVPGIDSVRKLGRFLLQAGSPSYFNTVGTRVLRGRTFTDADRAGTLPVVVVSENMAHVLWPGQDAIGRQMRIDSATAPPLTVIGVVETTRARLLTGDPEYWYYIPIGQYGTPDPILFVRAQSREPSELIEPLRRRLNELMPGSAYITVRPLRTLVEPTTRAWQFGATMFGIFGVLALLIAMVGLYSVISYTVAQRTHEFGVRMALGGQTNDVMRLVLREGLGVAVAGIAIGVLVAVWLGRWVEPLLYAQPARDPTIFAAVSVVLAVVALAASAVPAIRASRVDPVRALRNEV